mgnify:CR=1 FL=1
MAPSALPSSRGSIEPEVSSTTLNTRARRSSSGGGMMEAGGCPACSIAGARIGRSCAAGRRELFIEPVGQPDTEDNHQNILEFVEIERLWKFVKKQCLYSHDYADFPNDPDPGRRRESIMNTSARACPIS